jgi:hypothetical protein
MPPFAAGGGGDTLGLSSGGGEVYHQDPLHPEHGLTMAWLSRLGRNGRLLADKRASPLCCPVLGVGLHSAGSRLLLPLISLLSLRRGPSIRLQYDGP